MDQSEDSTGDLDTCLIELALTPQNLRIGGSGSTWYVVNEVMEVFEVFDGLEDGQTYTLVGGNTAYGEWEYLLTRSWKSSVFFF